MRMNILFGHTRRKQSTERKIFVKMKRKKTTCKYYFAWKRRSLSKHSQTKCMSYDLYILPHRIASIKNTSSLFSLLPCCIYTHRIEHTEKSFVFSSLASGTSIKIIICTFFSFFIPIAFIFFA